MKALVQKRIVGNFVYANDLEKTSQWYCENLGFTLGVHDFSNFVELTIDGDYVLHLLKTDNEVPAVRASFSFGTDDIKETHRLLLARGVEVQPLERYSDHKSFTLKDCVGNPLMISQFD
ncbi:hypothetical protein DFQ01_105103 [Paenibacillus cellulosilyticus]|uniref:VOC domain-containing protein n=1 Tax=Paenibacillus cellulosilyticus TaxID=375489 RepID=A0A2V2YXU8_9BACL|nr:VOC family protein [Paenibacillus cellulosilyticus]PWW05120.1 hypothetical protein DFQ01_105103 [Paenibacillus cellulosilyticus]QKS48669.1 VOC family protein [Paenibacillus cellulosilyticus]